MWHDLLTRVITPTHWSGINWREAMWWKFMPGRIIEVRWPVGEIEVGPNSRSWDMWVEDERQVQFSTDPNDHYRPDLEKYVGKQGWDWNWKIGIVVASNGRGTTGHDTLLIKIRRGKTSWATYLGLRWA